MSEHVLMTDAGISYLVQERLIADDDAVVVAAAAPQRVKRDTKRIGDISELRVAAALAEAGYAVSKPLGESQRYDLIIDDGERLQRVQVKTGRIRGGVIAYNCCSTHGHRRTVVTTRPYTGQIDLLAVFCADNGKVYVLPEAEITRSKSHLRLVPPRNNMVKTIRWASQYELA
ncbi:MAG TPA: group I intron-associated PD-(D/E)XK endonuclease [Candidatus Elarobacter sp.]